MNLAWSAIQLRPPPQLILDRFAAAPVDAVDIFGVAEGVRPEDQLNRYAAEVYQAVHAPLGGQQADA